MLRLDKYKICNSAKRIISKAESAKQDSDSCFYMLHNVIISDGNPTHFRRIIGLLDYGLIGQYSDVRIIGFQFRLFKNINKHTKKIQHLPEKYDRGKNSNLSSIYT